MSRFPGRRKNQRIFGLKVKDWRCLIEKRRRKDFGFGYVIHEDSPAFLEVVPEKGCVKR